MLDRVARVIARIEDISVGIILLGATFILFQGVILRYAFNYAFAWTEEVVRYSIVWLVFLGGSIAARRGAHIAMDIVVVYLPPRAKLFFMGDRHGPRVSVHVGHDVLRGVSSPG